MSDERSKALEFIRACQSSEQLKTVIKNARRRSDDVVERVATLRLYAVLPSADPGTLEHDVWRSVYALEGALKAERNKTTLLARTRQKITRDGELKTVADLVMGTPSDGFQMLIDRDMIEYTFEAVPLRHPGRFAPGVLEVAARRIR